MSIELPGTAFYIKLFQIIIASVMQMHAISFDGWCYNFSYVKIEITTAISEMVDRKATPI